MFGMDESGKNFLMTTVEKEYLPGALVIWYLVFISTGKKNSLGAITLVCLNFPPIQPYKVENVYLFGIIPGPKELSTEPINHLLRPLVEKLKMFWSTGYFLNSTASHPTGRLIRVAIFPLIADLPALQKLQDLEAIKQKDIEEIDISQFAPRNHVDHLSHASEWLKREALVKKHGAQWSILNELKYWQPVEYCSIELMHALILVDLKDHSMRFFALPTVGEELKKIKEKDKHWQNDQSHTEPPHTDTYGPKPKSYVNMGKGKRKRDSDLDSTTMNKKTKRTHLHNQATSSSTPDRNLRSSCSRLSSNSSSESGTVSNSSTSSTHSYKLRLRKQKFYDMSEDTPAGSEEYL
ncbi:hypothetical protein MJO28_016955 [Puccinia striiformis f. sp. tritici]|nr:hypothetical protein MJO28_016955 [Puccinia striiformis f. sp. tritici]